MTAVLSPPRLPLPLSPVEEGLDDQQEWPWGIALRHEYLHSLASPGKESWEEKEKNNNNFAKTRDNAFGLSLPPAPEKVAVARRGCRGGLHVRSWSEPVVHSRRMATATVVTASPVEETDTAPSSPPELSYSKSSKSSSSSIRSDSSDEEEVGEKSSQCDDVSIAEERRRSNDDSNLKPESRPTLKRPPPRVRSTGDATRASFSPPINSLPNGLAIGLRRGFTSPSMPSLFEPAPHTTSRSPSPPKPFMRNGVNVSPQLQAGATPRLGAESRSPSSSAPGLFPRRKSWQPGQRKTTKELEAEYNDEEVEVPDDFVLENVPISPMPGQPSLSQTLSQTPSRSESPRARSATPSPQRRPSHTNLHSANVPKNAKRPSAPRILSNGQYGSPRSPRQPRPNTLHHSNTIAAFPPRQLYCKKRSKSWTEDLNDEARKLSAALEAYSEQISSEKPSSETNSPSSSPHEPTPLKQRAMSAFDLSLMKNSNIMIDPLPISKEKEAVLARTRPSWLPPKDQKEEKKHMKEWAQMMARAAENQKKRALQDRERLESRLEMRNSIARIWDQHVLPNWHVVLQEPRTRELWWRGVTPRSRGVVWQKAIGNELELSDSSFEAALKRANALEEKIAEMTSEERADSKEAAWFTAISRDILTACPELTDAEQRPGFQNALSDVLKAYSMYRSDVGYVYGTHLVAGILCLHLRPSNAFVTLANMLNRHIPLAFHVHDTTAMAQTYDLVLSTLNYKFTKLHDHLTSAAVGLNPEEYLDPIFRCLFAYHLPVEHVNRVWDIYVFEGDKALIRAAVAVLGKLEGKLYGNGEEILEVIGWRNERMWDLGGEDDFILAVKEAGKVDLKGEMKSP